MMQNCFILVWVYQGSEKSPPEKFEVDPRWSASPTFFHVEFLNWKKNKVENNEQLNHFQAGKREKKKMKNIKSIWAQFEMMRTISRFLKENV